MKNHLRTFLIVLLIFSWQILSAKGTQEDHPDSRVITDTLGREVSVPLQPERIVLAGRGVIMLADALYSFPGTAEKIVGMSRTDQGMGNFIELLDHNLGDKFHWSNDVGPEQLLEAEPDVVILKDFMRDKLGEALENLGVAVVYLNLESPERFREDITTLGALLNQPERAEELNAFYRREREAVQRESPPEKPSTLVLNHSVKGGSVSFMVPPPGWIQTTLTELAGGNPVWLEETNSPGWSRVGMEQILSWDPDKIFIISYRTSAVDVVESLKVDPTWGKLKAVRQGGIYPFPGDFYSWGQPDSRWILGLWWMNRRLIGDSYDTLERTAMEEKAREVFTFLYRLKEPGLSQLIERIQ